MEYDLIVVGGGPAGLSAGIYGVRSGLKTTVIEKGIAGGLVGEAPLVENYLGIDSVKGMELVERMKAHATKYVELKEFEPVTDIKARDGFLISTEKGEYSAKAIIISTGTTHRKLGVKGEAEFKGKGVCSCAVCDGFLFKDKKVAVVGGGNHAVMDAIYLDSLGCNVTLIHRRDKLRAEEYLQNKLKENVKVCLNSGVEEILGDNSVKGIRIHDKGKNTKSELEVAGVFISVGETPNNDLAKKIGVQVDESGYIQTDKSQRTNVPRVYAAGDITGGVRQALVACSEGAVAALSAFEDIKNPYWVKKEKQNV